jgi:hypothetical protein
VLNPRSGQGLSRLRGCSVTLALLGAATKGLLGSGGGRSKRCCWQGRSCSGHRSGLFERVGESRHRVRWAAPLGRAGPHRGGAHALAEPHGDHQRERAYAPNPNIRDLPKDFETRVQVIQRYPEMKTMEKTDFVKEVHNEERIVTKSPRPESSKCTGWLRRIEK